MSLPLTLRSVKGSPLTHNEVDANWLAINDGVREKLTADRTYYVAEAGDGGDDSNTGLTALDPFLTIQHAVNTAVALDLNQYRVVIQLADGTYPDFVILPEGIVGGPGWHDLFAFIRNSINIVGNEAHPENVIIGSAAIWLPWTISVNGNGYYLNGVTVVATNLGGFDVCVCIRVTDRSYFIGKKLHFANNGGPAVVMTLELDSTFHSIANGDWTVYGANWFAIIYNVGGRLQHHGDWITLPDSPTWEVAFLFSNTGTNYFAGTEFSGAATGRKFILQANSTIVTNRHPRDGIDSLPGSISGTMDGSSAFDSLESGRVLLTADTHFYVRPDGDDNHTGQADAPEWAWLTIQHAIDYVSGKFDMGEFRAYIHVADGTYAEAVTLRPVTGGLGLAGTAALQLYTDYSISIVGNTTTPASVIIQGPAEAYTSTVDCKGSGWRLTGLEFRAPAATNTCCFSIDGPFQVLLDKLNFNNSTAAAECKAIASSNNAIVQGTTNALHFYGTAWASLFYVVQGAQMFLIYTPATVHDTPAFSGSCCQMYGNTGFQMLTPVVGSATGLRYNVLLNATTFVGGSATFFPGSVAGSAATGGQYG